MLQGKSHLTLTESHRLYTTYGLLSTNAICLGFSELRRSVINLLIVSDQKMVKLSKEYALRDISHGQQTSKDHCPCKEHHEAYAVAGV